MFSNLNYFVQLNFSRMLPHFGQKEKSKLKKLRVFQWQLGHLLFICSLTRDTTKSLIEFLVFPSFINIINYK